MSDRILTGEEIRLAILPLLKKYRAEKAILFGSYARNEADGKSDIDLLIIGGEHFAPTDVFCIADELYRSLAKNVDVYELSEINAGSNLYNTILQRECRLHEVYR
ncbi:nucleotidyltransferase family protein [Acutalibacter sp. 1XD8-36]|uniref:nucleotidyltransferase family protein n=1 Tax=Acutalibacter sp. 1XD8-36 TaxID=2320852 RepID=UPI001412D77F|nr:nucleotidyltransferase domain-containing protein [Acutalibacter sp. 1XD8-36]NBJ90760.1 nucleotidyltransferase domain-containing protein [Acutalibacter sp. 1XD8-36]